MLKYYASANSCNGYVSFLEENIADCRTVAVAEGTTAYLRQKIFEGLKNECTELILKPGSENDLEAIKTKDSVIVFKPERMENELYYHLGKAKEIHDRWEQIYISAMDFKKAEVLAKKVSQSLIQNKKGHGKSKNIHRFFGSMLSDGSVNYINDITEGFEKRIFIKGRPGSGKSTLLKRVRQDALDAGFDTETYLCSFDPNSLDMVVIRELSVCIFDSTSPHEMFPERAGDEIVDIYAAAITAGTDEDNSEKLKRISDEYNKEIKNAKKHL